MNQKPRRAQSTLMYTKGVCQSLYCASFDNKLSKLQGQLDNVMKGRFVMEDKSLSVSVSHGREALRHDRREYCPNNVHKELIPNDVFLKVCNDIRAEFNDFFEDDVKEYNNRTRKDRRISDYYEKIASTQDRDKAPKPVYEYVFQYGNKYNNNVLDPKFEQINEDTKEMLVRFAEDFGRIYPSFHVVAATVHMDETTPHLHIAFIPVGTGYKNGMKHQCSLTKALNNMGYHNSTAKNKDGENVSVLALTSWQNHCKDVMEEIMEEYGYEREYMNNTDKHMAMTPYKYACAMKELCEDIDYNEKRLDSLDKREEEKRGVIEGLSSRIEDLVDIKNGLSEDIQKLHDGKSELLEEKKSELEQRNEIVLSQRKQELEEEYAEKEAEMNKKIALADKRSEAAITVYNKSQEYRLKINEFVKSIKDDNKRTQAETEVKKINSRFDDYELDEQVKWIKQKQVWDKGMSM